MAKCLTKQQLVRQQYFIFAGQGRIFELAGVRQGPLYNDADQQRASRLLHKAQRERREIALKLGKPLRSRSNRWPRNV
jgi:hypothetical protein